VLEDGAWRLVRDEWQAVAVLTHACVCCCCPCSVHHRPAVRQGVHRGRRGEASWYVVVAAWLVCYAALTLRACARVSVAAAQQDAERARFIVEKAHQDRLSIVIRAEGEARSAEMIGKAIASNPGFVQLRRIDAAKDIATTVARSANTVYLNSDSLLLNLMDTSKTAPGTPGAK
jgi:hypothetical protein